MIGMLNPDFMAGQKMLLKHLLARLVNCLKIIVFPLKSSQIDVNLGFAGQIKSFCGQHLARGPYVVHACPMT